MCIDQDIDKIRYRYVGLQATREFMTKIGRNAPCPCGSGKKYKKCCLGKVDPTQAVPESDAPALPPGAPPSTLASGAFTDQTFNWNFGRNDGCGVINFTGSVDVVPGETDTADNSLTEPVTIQ